MPSTNPQQAYSDLLTELRELALINSIGGVLNWDEQTYMPHAAGTFRADQAALLSRLSHERFTSPRVGDLLSAVEQSPLVTGSASDGGPSDISVNVCQTRRRYDRATKLPTSLVEELTKVGVLAQQAWADARKRSDYPAFRPWLDRILKLKRQECECVGYVKDPYDALLDQFEVGETAEGVKATFEALRVPLIELVGKIVGSGKEAPLHLLQRHYPAAAQASFAADAAKTVGFDFTAGRLDVSVHPFCTHLGPGDARITTRYDESYVTDAFFGVLHETGHALYNQGLPKEHFGLPVGEDISLGIHESQSRLWENLVGRSRSFWQYFLPKAKVAFPEALAGVSLEQWHFAINDVRPSLIRTESDETTYNLHVLIRFEIERALLRDELSTADLPAAWNEKTQQYLGITPPDDARGCLQDIHWSGGAIGYFPTYTLGNLYAAQLFEAARRDLGDLDAQFATGEFKPLLGWLREKIHSQGMRYSPRDLAKRATGEDLGPEALLRHLRKRASELYGV